MAFIKGDLLLCFRIGYNYKSIINSIFRTLNLDKQEEKKEEKRTTITTVSYLNTNEIENQANYKTKIY